MNNEIQTLPLATTNKRIASFIIDDLVIVALLLAIFYEPLMQMAARLPATLTSEDMTAFQEQMSHFSADNLLAILSIKILYHTFFVWQNGMTLGKYIMKIKVVEESGYSVTLTKAFLRAVLRIVSEAIFYLGFLLAFFLPLKQTLHDKLSNCVVTDA